MSQAEFARYLNIPKYNIQNWEQGSRMPLNYVTNMIERIMHMDNYDLELIDKESYVSDGYKITFYLIPNEKGQHDIVFYYENKKYCISAPWVSSDHEGKVLIDGSSFYVDDKIDDIMFEKKAGL